MLVCRAGFCSLPPNAPHLLTTTANLSALPSSCLQQGALRPALHAPLQASGGGGGSQADHPPGPLQGAGLRLHRCCGAAGVVTSATGRVLTHAPCLQAGPLPPPPAQLAWPLRPPCPNTPHSNQTALFKPLPRSVGLVHRAEQNAGAARPPLRGPPLPRPVGGVRPAGHRASKAGRRGDRHRPGAQPAAAGEERGCQRWVGGFNRLADGTVLGRNARAVQHANVDVLGSGMHVAAALPAGCAIAVKEHSWGGDASLLAPPFDVSGPAGGVAAGSRDATAAAGGRAPRQRSQLLCLACLSLLSIPAGRGGLRRHVHCRAHSAAHCLPAGPVRPRHRRLHRPRAQPAGEHA